MRRDPRDNKSTEFINKFSVAGHGSLARCCVGGSISKTITNDHCGFLVRSVEVDSVVGFIEGERLLAITVIDFDKPLFLTNPTSSSINHVANFG